MAKILIIEDLTHLMIVLKTLLETEGYIVDEAEDLKTASRKLEQNQYDVIIMDLKLPDGNSISLFDRFSNKLKTKSIIITANATIPSVVEAIKNGAFNYLEKPVDETLLLAQVKNILQINQLKEGHDSLIHECSSNFTFDRIIYASKRMEEVITRAQVLAQTNNTVLINGETGSGKEVFAHAIHNASPRKSNIFMPVNCASIPAELFESELFGFEKGAFTGAVGQYNGRFIQSDKGTLFLDEIGELPLLIQAKLLRVLDDHSIFPLKGQKPIPVDVRLITATNRDLEQEVKLKQFRNDLYFRLRESALLIPPLRERLEDILPLANHFITIYNHVYQKEVARLSAEVETFFLSYAWEGNVRQLKNVIKSIIPFKTDRVIEMSDLSYSMLEKVKTEDIKGLTLAEGERNLIYKVLKLTNFNIYRSAEILGTNRPRLYRKMKEYGLDVSDDALEQE